MVTTTIHSSRNTSTSRAQSASEQKTKGDNVNRQTFSSFPLFCLSPSFWLTIVWVLVHVKFVYIVLRVRKVHGPVHVSDWGTTIKYGVIVTHRRTFSVSHLSSSAKDVTYLTLFNACCFIGCGVESLKSEAVVTSQHTSPL
ncbi:hypothetical protein RRG08_062376 [Elysia crispata]|uniref:Uncharacterized protein n=1 Tax=Elysia crispata TaxID=231223 RepID=A0AAE0YG96_9GAST|nr:hypothetical protein RRG08_062376 [Elysia crispata]